MPNNVVIVESPAKAKTINKYLGDDYVVIASYGHVRDLPPKDGSVRPDEDFAMDWEISDRSDKPLGEISKAIKGATHVFLATDPDREGEAISWHVQEILRQKNLLGKVGISRVTFNEITKSAIVEAFRNPREINRELVDAYLARRALDYLVGFNLSPVLWRKLPGSKSAGRVQSVALRLICERELEIERFVPREYWSITADLKTDSGDLVPARLNELDGKKLEKFAFGNEGEAKNAVARVEAGTFTVKSIEHKTVRRNPAPPFITSTLQQEASRKLGFGATKTMRTAQRLYEGIDIGGETVGLITYMRTDGVQLGQEAIASCRQQIGQAFGDKYLPASPRIYKSTAKNAQEAHEAIRPTDLSRTPSSMGAKLPPDERALYELIWKRTMAAQMESAVLDQVSVDIADQNGKVVLRATGSVLVFDGFLKLYREDKDEPSEEDSENRRLPIMKEGQALSLALVKPNQHFTEPLPRYSEASLVKRLEELGIGRPSTYASIIQVLQDRNYVKLDKKRFVPEDRGRLVTVFLENFFKRYVAYDFTAELEEKLDAISAGKIDWKELLREFWTAFSTAIAGTKDLKISDVIDRLDAELGPYLFPPPADGSDPRVCPVCKTGHLGLRLGKFGAFIGCSNYPTCPHTRQLIVHNDGSDGEPEGGGILGNDPVTGREVAVKRGPYGSYVQLAAPEGEKPKRVSLAKGMNPAEMKLDQALKLLALPRDVGIYPETGKMISAAIGRFGPYLKVGDTFVSLPAGEDLLTIGLNRAIDLVVAKAEAQAKSIVKTLGPHPETQDPVTLNKGRFGFYLRSGRIMASLPKSVDTDALTMDDAVRILAAKAKAKAPKGKGKGKGKAATDKTAPAPKTKKPAAKKAAPKKAAPKKVKTA